jgi:hypothetical protein
MTEWKITATTVYCEAVKEEVTLIIDRDGTARCTWHSKTVRKPAGADTCAETDCAVIAGYRSRLLENEGEGR